MIKFATLAAATVFALAGCTPNPDRAATLRAEGIAQAFPDVADRSGIELVFPSGTVLEVIYRPNDVSAAVVQSRVQGYCQRILGAGFGGTVALVRPPQEKSVTNADGTQLLVRQTFFDCTP